ncbi:hypothetical protein NE237_015880 [Protea cynaroides]|uniref:Uncharacterized protein n=1 Tax=Protea cynaroides TaxID=273540 RepID=A0A9Q0QRM5_9MAGN|nr:hypothetical protein NE237_015880 [Protea cynaroides]
MVSVYTVADGLRVSTDQAPRARVQASRGYLRVSTDQAPRARVQASRGYLVSLVSEVQALMVQMPTGGAGWARIRFSTGFGGLGSFMLGLGDIVHGYGKSNFTGVISVSSLQLHIRPLGGETCRGAGGLGLNQALWQEIGGDARVDALRESNFRQGARGLSTSGNESRAGVSSDHIGMIRQFETDASNAWNALVVNNQRRVVGYYQVSSHVEA